MVYFRSVGWPHYSQNSDNNVRSAKSSLPVQNNSPNFTRLGKQLTQGVCCASLTCVSKTIGRREIFFGRTRTRSKIGRCAVSGSRWRSREGVLLCGAAAVDPRRWGRRLWQGLLWPVWGSWGGGPETKVGGRSWDRRQRLTQTNCEKRESELEPKGKMPDPCMVTVKAGPQHSRVGLQQKV